jgi:hypothetical protein
VGFLDKAKEAAASAADGAKRGVHAAKDGIERSGVVDKARDAIDQKIHPDEPVVVPTEDELAAEREWLVSVERRHGLDPRTLLSAQEAGDAIGVALTLEPRLTGGDDVVEARFRAADRDTGVSIYSFHAFDLDDEWVPEGTYEFVTENLFVGDGEPGTEATGIGTRANLHTDSCVVLVGDRVIGVTVHQIDPDVSRAAAWNLAGLAATRVPVA